MRPVLSLLLVLLVAACVAAPSAPPQQATALPSRHLFGAGDPTRGAILEAAFAFARPDALRGRPEAAARAVMALEHLAVAIPNDQMYRAFNPLVALELAAGRDDVRRLLGIAPGAPPQAVIDSLSAASEALRAGDRAGAARALGPAVASDAAATLVRLDAMPFSAAAARATARAQAELSAMDQSDDDVIRRLRWPR